MDYAATPPPKLDSKSNCGGVAKTIEISFPIISTVAFTEIELAENLKVVEEVFWSRRRPPLQLRDQVREGQRISGQSIELFFVRPSFGRPGTFTEEPIAKVQFVRTSSLWRLFWKRANGEWYRYEPCREAPTLAYALQVINADTYSCFFG